MNTPGLHRLLVSLAVVALVAAVGGPLAAVAQETASTEVAAPTEASPFAAPWFDPAWQWRQVVRVGNPDYLGRFPTGSATIDVGDLARPDRADVRVATAEGRLVPHVVITGGARDARPGTVSVRFKLPDDKADTYYIYYGNPAAGSGSAPELPSGAGGVRLEMREYDGNVRTIEQFRTAFEEAKANVLGAQMQEQIYDSKNPFSDGAPKCLAIYQTVLRAPETGSYGLRFKATGYGSVLLDGEELMSQSRGLGSFTSREAVPLEQGDHELSICVFSRHPTTFITQLEWQPPGSAGFEAVPAEAFPTDVGFSVIGRQQFGKPISAYFNSGIVDQARLVRTDFVLSAVRFEAVAASSLGTVKRCAWDFGDGETGTGLTPVHTYVKPGTYTVTLTARDTLGFEDTFADTVTLPEDIRDKMELVFNEQEEQKIILGAGAVGAEAQPTVPLCVGLKFLNDRGADLTVEQRIEWNGHTAAVFSQPLSDLMQAGIEQDQLARLVEAIARLRETPVPGSEDSSPGGRPSGRVRTGRGGGFPSGPSGREGGTRGPSSAVSGGTGTGSGEVPPALLQALALIEKLADEAGGLSRAERVTRLKEAAARLTDTAGAVHAPLGPEADETVDRIETLVLGIGDTIDAQQTAALDLPGLDAAPRATFRVIRTEQSLLEREAVIETVLPNLPGRFSVTSVVRYGQIEIGRMRVRVLLDTDSFPTLSAYDPNLIDADGNHIIIKVTKPLPIKRRSLADVVSASPDALRVAVVDNSLCPGGPGRDAAKLYYGMLKQRLDEAFQSRTVTIERFATERDTLGHFPVKRLLEAGEAIERFQPHAVVIALDQEDLLARTPDETVETYLRLLINHIAARTQAKIVLVAPPPRPYAAEWSKADALALGRFALERNVELADVYEAVNLHERNWQALYLDDEAHDDVLMMYMNSAGQRIVADTILKALLRE